MSSIGGSGKSVLQKPVSAQKRTGTPPQGAVKAQLAAVERKEDNTAELHPSSSKMAVDTDQTETRRQSGAQKEEIPGKTSHVAGLAMGKAHLPSFSIPVRGTNSQTLGMKKPSGPQPGPKPERLRPNFLRTSQSAEVSIPIYAEPKGVSAVRKAVSESKNLRSDPRFRLKGKGMNKEIYELVESHIANKDFPKESFNWVASASTSGFESFKWRAQSAETKALKELSQHGVCVPETHSPLTKTQLGDDQAQAFIQEKVAIVAEKEKSTDHQFLNAVSRVGTKRGISLETTEAKALRNDAENLWSYLRDRGDIPDLQIALAKKSDGSLRLMVMDPGDPVSSGSYIDKHKSWVQDIGKALNIQLTEEKRK